MALHESIFVGIICIVGMYVSQNEIKDIQIENEFCYPPSNLTICMPEYECESVELN